MELLKQIAENPILIIAGIVITALGTLFGFWGVIIALRSRKYKRLAYSMTRLDLVRNNVSKIPNVQITYDGKQVRALSVSRVVFWNDGTDVIERSDIAPADILRIEAPPGADILGIRQLGATNESNQFGAKFDGKSVSVTFDYLEKGDGAGIEVTHTGLRLSFQGHIKGGGRILAKELGVGGDKRSRLIKGVAMQIAALLGAYAAAVTGSYFGSVGVIILAGMAMVSFLIYTIIQSQRELKPTPLERLLEKLSQDG